MAEEKGESMTQHQAVIDAMMSRVEWREYQRTEPLPDGTELFATHEGIMRFGPDSALRCYQLNNGQRVFDAEDCNRLLGL